MAIRVNGSMPLRVTRYDDKDKNESMRLATQRVKEDPNSPVPLDSEHQWWYFGTSEEEETS